MMAYNRSIGSKVILELASNTNEESTDSYFLSEFDLYETHTRYYLFGTSNSKSARRVLKINRHQTTELDIFEDPTFYSDHECNDLQVRLNASNLSMGGLKFVTKVYGIVGFIKFLEPYYMILITKRRFLGNVNGHSIYGIGDSKMLCLSHPSFQTTVASSRAENRYKKLFNAIDLTTDFYFSYTYRIMWSLQKNAIKDGEKRTPHDDMFIWNSYLMYGFRNQVQNPQWVVPLIHGYFYQKNLLQRDNTVYKITLLARRSRHFAGTRYLKRGVNERGRVANDVETEQIIHKEFPGKPQQISSVIQHRGSIPLLWSQATSVLSPKPEIKLKIDPNYKATNLHFKNLTSRYGNPIIVLNLVKTSEQKPREAVLCHEFSRAVEYLNKSVPEEDRILFRQWDLHKYAHSACTNVLEILGTITTDALNRVGFYYDTNISPSDNDHLSGTSKTQENQEEITNNSKKLSKLQCGVLRSNCIDCLDRTNVAQFSFGLAALGQQLHALGLHDNKHLAVDSSYGHLLMEMYESMGDALALQYGGSTAHHTVLSNRQGKWKAATQSLHLLRSIKRHYSNTYTDGMKQDAMNIFLGHYRPEIGKTPLWQLDSDNHHQLRRSELNLFSSCKPTMKRSLSAGGILGVCEFVLSPGLDFRLNHPDLDTLLENNTGVTNNRHGETNQPRCPTLKILTPDNNEVETALRGVKVVSAEDLSPSIFFTSPVKVEDEATLNNLSDEGFPKKNEASTMDNTNNHMHALGYSESFVKWINSSYAFSC